MNKNKYLLMFVFLLLFFVVASFGENDSQAFIFNNIEIYFSPNGGIRDRVISRINLSRKTINIAMYSFTSGEITWALENAMSRGVTVEIIADKGQSGGKDSEIKYLAAKGAKVRILKGKGRGVMHNKFAVFDEREVMTGSYNWTDNAENNNYENAIFIKDQKAVKRYADEFKKLIYLPLGE